MANTISIEESNRQQEIIQQLRYLLQDKGLQYYINTFGCQMNAHDSEKLRGILEEIGYVEASEEIEADMIVYNTCCVRENAEQKVYGRLGYLKNYKKKNPHIKIALCGCMMQQESVIETIQKKYNFIDLVFGTHNLYKFPELLQTNLETKETIFDIWKEHGEIVEDLPSIRKHFFKASVNIMYGCNNFCTYCIVPYVRGRERSRKPEDILKEIKSLTADGVKEVMLLGQNVNSYGKTLEDPISFAQLLEKIAAIDGLKRIRFMTSHPKDLSEELIEVMAQWEPICDHLHLPFQAGSSKTLRAMNRRYTKEQYLALIQKIKKAMPDIALTTDIIVGFPGETEEDFEETLDVVKQVGFDNAYTFLYSKRTGTPASRMEEQIPEAIAKERFNRLLDTLTPISHAKTQAQIGLTLDVLVEEINQQNDKMVTGRTSSNHLVHFPGSKELIGTVVPVKIINAKTYYLIGEPA